jgi:NMT1/THI5 like
MRLFRLPRTINQTFREHPFINLQTTSYPCDAFRIAPREAYHRSSLAGSGLEKLNMARRRLGEYGKPDRKGMLDSMHEPIPTRMPRVSMLAADKGFFQERGLKVDFIRVNSEPTIYQALIFGDIQATSGAPVGLVLSQLQNVDLVAIASWLNIVPYTIATREKLPTSSN